jgi:hypothetical protein
MPLNLFSHSRAASGKTEPTGHKPNNAGVMMKSISLTYQPDPLPLIHYPWRALNRRCVLLIT